MLCRFESWDCFRGPIHEAIASLKEPRSAIRQVQIQSYDESIRYFQRNVRFSVHADGRT